VFHPGEDWNIKAGSDCDAEIHAIADGEVVGFPEDAYCSWGALVVRHDNVPKYGTIYSVYGHMDSATAEVHANPHVTRGQVLGLVGAHGADNCHLHFEIRKRLVDDRTCFFPAQKVVPYQGTVDFVLANYLNPSRFIQEMRAASGGGDVFDLVLDSDGTQYTVGQTANISLTISGGQAPFKTTLWFPSGEVVETDSDSAEVAIQHTINAAAEVGAKTIAALVQDAAGQLTPMKTIEVDIQGAPVLAASPLSLSAPAAGGSTTAFTVTTTASWSASSDSTWATVIGGSDTGNGSFTVNGTANDTGSIRAASITVTGTGTTPSSVELTVTQDSVDAGLEGDVAPRTLGDGLFKAADATQQGRFVVGLDTPAIGFEYQRADCAPKSTSGDGKLASADWVQSRRFVVGLDTAAEAGGPTEAAAKDDLNGEWGLDWVKAIGARQVSIPTVTIPSGQQGSVSIVLDAQGDENAVSFSLHFDTTKLTYISSTKGVDVPADGTLTPNESQVAQGKLGFLVGLNTGAAFAAGQRQLVQVTFSAATVATQTQTPLTLADQPTARSTSDATANDLVTDFMDGTVTLGVAPPATLAVAPATQSAPAAGGSTGAFGVTTTAAWTAASNQTWATVVGGSSTGNGSFTVNCTANSTGSARTATITVTGTGTTPGTVQVTVTQAYVTPTLAVAPSTQSAPAEGGSTSAFNVTTTVPWTAASNQSWATVIGGSGTGSGSFTVNCTPNSTGSSRSASISVTAPGATGSPAIVSVSQAATTQKGSVQVAITPPTAVAANAQWRVTDGTNSLPWKTSGQTLSNLAASTNLYRVHFNYISGWVTPRDIPFAVIANQTTTVTGSYVADTCDRAVPVELKVSASGNNVSASTDADVPSIANDGRDVWYTFTPTVTDSYEVSLCGSSFDTTLNVYQGGCGQLEWLAGEDDDLQCSRNAILCMDLVGGQMYSIRVAGYNGATGDFVLLVSDTPCQAETIAPPAALYGEPNPSFGTTYEYTADVASSSLGHAIEYSFDWGDGSAPSTWAAPSGASHAWHSSGVNWITVSVRCQEHPLISGSQQWYVTVSEPPVPSVVGLQEAAAGTAITNGGFAVGQISSECNSAANGTVIGQTPAAGTQAPSGSSVALVVSTGPCNVTVRVPNVVGLTQATASAAITAAGLTVGTIGRHCSDSVPPGSVVTPVPAVGTQVSPGSAVALAISTGPCNVTVRVPNVVGQMQAAASTALIGANLTVGVVSQACSDTMAAGMVVSQTLAADTQVDAGSAVAIVVSSGACPQAVPNVVGRAQLDAEEAINTAGLTVGAVSQACSDTMAAGMAISQNPASGTQVPSGNAVALVVSTGPCPTITEQELRDLLTADFDTMDSNLDDLISHPEVLASLPGLPEEVFNAVDTDGDDQISRTEAGLDPSSPNCLGCTGCSGAKDALTFERMKKSFGDLFLGGLGLTVLLAYAKRRH
jgi:beta-lactam-binding protein with PASTA domain